MSTLHVLRVFVGEDGAHGNPLGVFLRGDEVPADPRQAVASGLGFAETVFVDDARSGRLRREGHDLTSLRRARCRCDATGSRGS